MGPENFDQCDRVFPYPSALGSLLYTRLTRPDCLVAISILCRFMKDPRPQHWAAVKDVFRYLKGTINRGLLYRSSGLTLSQPWTITLWVDSDYGTDPDTRRSRGAHHPLPVRLEQASGLLGVGCDREPREVAVIADFLLQVLFVCL